MERFIQKVKDITECVLMMTILLGGHKIVIYVCNNIYGIG
jgi:hypothetical protein